jgi:dipeptidase
VHGGGLLAASQTTASWAAALKPGDQVHWVTGTSSPCTGLFKPVRVLDPLDLGPWPTDRFDPKSMWWRHEQFARRVLANPAELAPVFRTERDKVESWWQEQTPDSRKAFADADTLLMEWIARVSNRAVTDTRPWWVRRYWARRNRWAGLI